MENKDELLNESLAAIFSEGASQIRRNDEGAEYRKIIAEQIIDTARQWLEKVDGQSSLGAAASLGD